MEAANLIPIKDFELIEIECDTSKTKYFLPNNTNFDKKKVKAIEIYNVGKVAVSPLNRATLNDVSLSKAFITLVDADGKEHLKQVPLASLVAANNNGLIRSLKDVIIVSQKSFIEFATTTGLSASESIVIGVQFES
jgi:hypothetical protein